ncbi:MAG: sulfurtransferase TusA family protein [Neomegalonema sp.]
MDETGQDAAILVDARGLKCPLPVLKARKRMADLALGEELPLLADDPAAVVDVPHFCVEQGHAMVSQEDQADGAILYRLRKGG